MKIVILSVNDYAGSGMRIRDAVRRQSDHEIILITKTKPGRSADYSVRGLLTEPVEKSVQTIHEKIRNKSMLVEHYKRCLISIQKLIDDADIVHFKGDEPPSATFAQYLTIPKGKKIVVTVGGSNFRRSSNMKISSLAKWPIDEYMSADLRTAITADLNYAEYHGIYTQQAVDSENVEMTVFNDPKEKIVIAHSPSSRLKKGTDQIFLPAIKILRDKGYNIEVDIIEKISPSECIDRKRKAHLFYDQAGVGFYGNAALEAMAAGIPTICQISREAIKQSDDKITKDHPVYSFRKASPNAAANSIKKAIDDYSPESIKRTKEFCDSFHSYSAVGAMWSNLYEELLKKGD